MSDFFSAMAESRSKRQAGFKKSLFAITLPDPINYTFHFGSYTSNEQAEYRRIQSSEEGRRYHDFALYIAFRAREATGKKMFDGDDQVFAAAKQLGEVQVAILEKIILTIEKEVDQIAPDLFEAMLGNSEKTE